MTCLLLELEVDWRRMSRISAHMACVICVLLLQRKVMIQTLVVVTNFQLLNSEQQIVNGDVVGRHLTELNLSQIKKWLVVSFLEY